MGNPAGVARSRPRLVLTAQPAFGPPYFCGAAECVKAALGPTALPHALVPQRGRARECTAPRRECPVAPAKAFLVASRPAT